MQTKIVGVVIPIYNVEEYLRECLDSVINQTYINLEIILVNDGSTDENSLNIAKEYTLKDKRITLFDKENGG
ncbi:glycosyltransferase family 2 protein, partial [Campylobacter jejuni]|nr:glycosyltransferase family 2 protein [Campylobacter jejuni]